MVLTDDSKMPFGKYQDKPMEEVPDFYLLWLWEKNEGRRKVLGRENQAVMNYIRENIDAIKQNLKK